MPTWPKSTRQIAAGQVGRSRSPRATGAGEGVEVGRQGGHQGFLPSHGLCSFRRSWLRAKHQCRRSAARPKWRIAQHPLAGFATTAKLPAATHQAAGRCLPGIPTSASIFLEAGVLPRSWSSLYGAISASSSRLMSDAGAESAQLRGIGITAVRNLSNCSGHLIGFSFIHRLKPSERIDEAMAGQGVCSPASAK